jgi:hypothetical protein
VYALSRFFDVVVVVVWHSELSFPLSTAFIVSHKFGYPVPLFSLNSKKSLISFFISPLTKLSLSEALFSFQCELSVIFVAI